MSNREVKKLYRNIENQVIMGVCSGLADYLVMDVNIVRLGTIIIAIIFPPLLFVYIVAGLMLPIKPQYKDAKIVEEKEK